MTEAAPTTDAAAVDLVPFGELPMRQVADALAAAFGEDGAAGHTPTAWRAMLGLELESGRCDPALSTALVQNGRVLGACIARLGDAPYAHIGATGIRPGRRGQGLGRRLVSHVLQGMLGRGYDRVTLEVERPNPAAESLYESLGFRPQRELLTVQLRKERFRATGRLRTVRVAAEEALAVMAGFYVGGPITGSDGVHFDELIQEPQPAFQRRLEYLRTFVPERQSQGALIGGAVFQAVNVGGPHLGFAMYRGSQLFTMTACDFDDQLIVSTLLQVALDKEPALRLIHVPEDSPAHIALLRLGAEVTGRATEMCWGRPEPVP